MAQVFRTAGSDAFLSNSKTFTPFSKPFNNDTIKSVGDFIDTQCSINNSLVSTVGKNKTYSLVYGLPRRRRNGAGTFFSSYFGITGL
jgi:hypothetical protein